MYMALMQMRETLQGNGSDSAKVALKCMDCVFRSPD